MNEAFQGPFSMPFINALKLEKSLVKPNCSVSMSKQELRQSGFPESKGTKLKYIRRMNKTSS